MPAALNGDREAALLFFRAFLAGPLYVPERYQAHKLSDAPRYPSDLFNLLGLQDRERVIIPVFSRAEMIIQWCGNELSHTCLSGQALLERLPDEWWLCLNPGGEIEKEFSPWEARLLKKGPESIPEILEDLLQDTEPVPLNIETVSGEEMPELKKALQEAAGSLPGIEALYLLRENFTSPESDEVQTRLLIGAELNEQSAQEADSISKLLRDAGAPHRIGAEPLRVFAGHKEEMAMRIFSVVEPFYRRRRSWLARLSGAVLKKNRR